MNSRLFFLGILFASFALADPLEVIFSGTGSGTLGTETFTDSDFTLTFFSDTSVLSTLACCPHDITTPKGTPAEFTISGIGSGSLTGNQAVFVNPAEDDLGIWVHGSPDFLTLGNFAFATYNLASDIGPIGGTASALSEFLPTSFGDHDRLSLKSVSDLIVTVDVAAVPEPSMLAMAGLAAIGCGLIARRRRV